MQLVFWDGSRFVGVKLAETSVKNQNAKWDKSNQLQLDHGELPLPVGDVLPQVAEVIEVDPVVVAAVERVHHESHGGQVERLILNYIMSELETEIILKGLLTSVPL